MIKVFVVDIFSNGDAACDPIEFNNERDAVKFIEKTKENTEKEPFNGYNWTKVSDNGLEYWYIGENKEGKRYREISIFA